jgi:hypothetical protein
VDLDAAAADLGADIRVVGLAHLVVVDDLGVIPDLDPEPVSHAAANEITVGVRLIPIPRTRLCHFKLRQRLARCFAV